MNNQPERETERSVRLALRTPSSLDADAILSAARARSVGLRRRRYAQRGVAAVAVAGVGVMGAVNLPGWYAGGVASPASSEPSPSPTTAEPTPTADPTTATDPTTAASGLGTGADAADPSINVSLFQMGSVEQMPAWALWESIWGSGGRTSQERLLDRDAATGACMEAAGFDYIYADESDFRTEPAADAHGHVMGSIEWAQEWGYGLVAYPPEMDPVDETPEEEAAWEEVLNQPGYDDAHLRCDLEAFAAVSPGYGDLLTFSSEPEGAILQELVHSGAFAIAQWQSGVSSDGADQVDAVISEWQVCMDAAGYPGQNDPGLLGAGPSWDFELRYLSALGLSVDSDGETYGYLTAADREQLLAEHPELAQLQQEEIAAARADMTCRDQVDLGERLMAAEAQSQQEWIDEHRAELDDAIAAFEAYRAERS